MKDEVRDKEELLIEIQELRQDNDNLRNSFEGLSKGAKLDGNLVLSLFKAINTTSDAIFLTDLEGIITYVNAGFTALYGYAADEVVGKVTPRIIKSGMLDKEFYKGFWKTLKNKTEVKGEMLNRRKSGEIVYVDGTASPIYDKHRTIFGFLGIQRDITEQKQVEQDLKESQQITEGIINSLPARVFWKDKDLVYLGCNTLFANDAGFSSPNDVIGKDDFQMVWSKVAELYRNDDMQVIKSKKPKLDFEETQFTAEGIEIDLLTSKTPLFNMQGEVLGVIGTYVEITERKKTERELNESEKQLRQLDVDKDRFISILGHDLKSPVQSLLGLSGLLAKNIHTYDIDKIENFAQNIYKSARNSYKLLEDLLMWAGAQQGKIPFKPQKLSFEDISTDILETLNSNAEAKNIRTKYDSVNGIQVFADVDMLKTVLRNLVSNAIKFTNNGGAIEISAEQNSEDVIISVSDNGIGIPPKNLAMLFDISEVLTTKGTANEKGTGLGLLLCKDFVEKHGGRIWAESEVGKGSEFKFTLPENAVP